MNLSKLKLKFGEKEKRKTKTHEAEFTCFKCIGNCCHVTLFRTHSSISVFIFPLIVLCIVLCQCVCLHFTVRIVLLFFSVFFLFLSFSVFFLLLLLAVSFPLYLGLIFLMFQWNIIGYLFALKPNSMELLIEGLFPPKQTFYLSGIAENMVRFSACYSTHKTMNAGMSKFTVYSMYATNKYHSTTLNTKNDFFHNFRKKEKENKNNDGINFTLNIDLYRICPPLTTHNLHIMTTIFQLVYGLTVNVVRTENIEILHS